MATTLEALESRLATLEAEMAGLRALVVPASDESAAERGARALAQARRDKPRLRAVMKEVMAKLGISGEPVPPEQLRAMMAADGVKAEENLFSRGIMEMREE
jgi:hypothetical protein